MRISWENDLFFLDLVTFRVRVAYTRSVRVILADLQPSTNKPFYALYRGFFYAFYSD